MQKPISLARPSTSRTEDERRPREQHQDANPRLTDASGRQTRLLARRRTSMPPKTERADPPLARTMAPIFGGLATKAFSHTTIIRTRSRAALFQKTVTISLLNRMLTNQSKDLEIILVSVLLLAGHELDERSVSGQAAVAGPVMHFQPHMPRCRWIDVYGRLEEEPAHSVAMVLLVRQLGGLSKITMPGLADLVAL
ncbi:hypothetical protein NU219Hw_g5457t1 [Hortaea werneckii]